MSEQGRVVSAAKRIALCTLASRVTGMLRDMLLVQMLGLTWVADAFNYGFQIPNLFRRLFGEGALAAVFVPRFTRTLETGGRDAAWALLARTRGLLILTVVGVIVVIEGVLLAVWLSTPADDPRRAYDVYLLLALTAVMLPFMLTVCVLALLGSILNCVGSFVPAALAPLVLNLGMIAAILWAAPAVGGGPDVQVLAVALSVPLAGGLQLLMLAPVLRRHNVRVGAELRPRDPQVRQMIAMMGPVAIGQGALLLSTFLDVQLCTLLTQTDPASPSGRLFGVSFDYPLQAGALTAVSVAQRLQQFPLGVLVISLATAALPALSRAAARGEWDGWAGQIRQTLRLAVFEGLLAGAMMVVLAAPIVRLLFEYGRFDAQDTQRAAWVLGWYGVGMWAFCAQHIVLRGFYSLGDVRTPVLLSCVLLPVNFLLSLLLVWFEPIREAAFAISSVATCSVSVAAGVVLLSRRLAHGAQAAGAPRGERLIDGATAVALLKMLMLAAASAAVVLACRAPLSAGAESLSASVIAARLVETLGGLGLGTLVFLALAWMLRMPEVGVLFSSVRGREK